MSDRPDVPDFAVTLRGYERAQVDEYVLRLTRDLDEAHARAVDAEQRLATRPAQAGAYEDLGSHVAGLLRRAQEEADQLRADAQRAADDLRTLASREAAAAGGERDAELGRPAAGPRSCSIGPSATPTSGPSRPSRRSSRRPTACAVTCGSCASGRRGALHRDLPASRRR